MDSRTKWGSARKEEGCGEMDWGRKPMVFTGQRRKGSILGSGPSMHRGPDVGQATRNQCGRNMEHQGEGVQRENLLGLDCTGPGRLVY